MGYCVASGDNMLKGYYVESGGNLWVIVWRVVVIFYELLCCEWGNLLWVIVWGG